jgi:hypothetical protein
MDIGPPHAGIAQKGIAAAGYGEVELVDASAGAYPSASGNGQAQAILVQAAQLDVAAPAMQRDIVQGDAADGDVQPAAADAAILAPADLALADAQFLQQSSGPVTVMRAGPPAA